MRCWPRSGSACPRRECRQLKVDKILSWEGDGYANWSKRFVPLRLILLLYSNESKAAPQKKPPCPAVLHVHRHRNPSSMLSRELNRIRSRQGCEEFHVLLLDSKNHLVRDCKISKGILDRAVVHAKEIFRAAIQGCCKTIILVHNHPTGDCEPSPHDIEASKSLVKAGKLIGIEVLDHVIIGKPSENNASCFFSMREKGLLSSTD